MHFTNGFLLPMQGLNRDQPLVVGNTYVKYNCWRFKGNTVAVSKLCKVQTHDLTLSFDFLTARINILFYWRLLLESQVTYGWSIIAVCQKMKELLWWNSAKCKVVIRPWPLSFYPNIYRVTSDVSSFVNYQYCMSRAN